MDVVAETWLLDSAHRASSGCGSMPRYGSGPSTIAGGYLKGAISLEPGRYLQNRRSMDASFLSLASYLSLFCHL